MLHQMNAIEHWRKEARLFSLSDKLGNLLVSMLELMQTVLMNGPREQALQFKIQALSLECSTALKNDTNKDSKLRSLVYGVTASMCALLDGLNGQPEEEEQANEDDSGMAVEVRSITDGAVEDQSHSANGPRTAPILESLLAAANAAPSSTSSNGSIGQRRKKKKQVPAKKAAIPIAPPTVAVNAVRGSVMKDEIAESMTEFHLDDVNLEMETDDVEAMDEEGEQAPAQEANFPTERNAPGSSTNAVHVFTAPFLPRQSTRPEAEEQVQTLAYSETPHRPKRAIKIELFSEDSADEDSVIEMRNNSKRRRLSEALKKQAKSEKKGSEKDGRRKNAAKKKTVKRAAPKYVETEYETEDEDRMVVTKKESLQCDHCEKAFSTRRKLVSHVRTHTGEKPFNCSECGSAFIERGYLNRHLRNDHSIAPYKCEECDEDFERFLQLVRHRRATH